MRNKSKVLILTALIGITIAIVGCNQRADRNNGTVATSTNSDNGAPSPALDQLAEGRDLYQQNCAKCHRDTGDGGKITIDGKELDPKDLTTDKMKSRTDQKLYDDIAEGSPDDGMPAFRDKLSAAQIRQTMTYIRTRLQHVPDMHKE